jgi:hypothetical protein
MGLLGVGQAADGRAPDESARDGPARMGQRKVGALAAAIGRSLDGRSRRASLDRLQASLRF